MRYINLRTGARWLLVGIGVLVCLTASTLVILHIDTAKAPGSAATPSANYSSSVSFGSGGIPAITPRPNLVEKSESTASGGIATLPTFTADDANAWVTAHGVESTKATGTLTVKSVTFLAYDPANPWLNLGDNLGLPAGTLLCVVVLDGTFTDTIPTYGLGPRFGPLTYSYALEVFDGVTGNFLKRSLTNASIPAALAGPATPTS
jgi:hypothetical protein